MISGSGSAAAGCSARAATGRFAAFRHDPASRFTERRLHHGPARGARRPPLGRHALERLEPLSYSAVQPASASTVATPARPTSAATTSRRAGGRPRRAVGRDERRRPAPRAVWRRRPGARLRSLGCGPWTAQRRRDVGRVRHRWLTVARTRQGLSRLDPAWAESSITYPSPGCPFRTSTRRLRGGRALPVFRFGRRAGERPEGPAAAIAPAESGPDHRHRAPRGRRVGRADLQRNRERCGSASRGTGAEFAVLDFTETAHEYAYRLQATDARIPLGRQRQLTFVGLAPGRYALEVRGRDAFGRWSASLPLNFEVVPPLWMTPWFRGLALATVVLLALGAHLVRLRSLRARNAVLERLQSQREQALADARRSQAELEGLMPVCDSSPSVWSRPRGRMQSDFTRAARRVRPALAPRSSTCRCCARRWPTRERYGGSKTR